MDLYTDNTTSLFRTAVPQCHTTEEGEVILYIAGHEVMSSYQRPYMQALAEIVTRNGGNILNIGYGLGLLDAEIEKYRACRALKAHYVIEINEHLSKLAEKTAELTVLNVDWNEGLSLLKGIPFSGIVYDGYPLSDDIVHRDGLIFIHAVAQHKLLEPGGILTFYVDAVDTLGDKFRVFLNNLGFECNQITRIPIQVPLRDRQIWQQDHFLAPVVQLKNPQESIN